MALTLIWSVFFFYAVSLLLKFNVLLYFYADSTPEEIPVPQW